MESNLVLTIELAGDFSEEANEIMDRYILGVEGFDIKNLENIFKDRKLMIKEIGVQRDRKSIGGAIATGGVKTIIKLVG